jgi:hypothetical protein
MMYRISFVWLLLFAASAAFASGDRFVQKLALPDGQAVVVAEGDLEARSIGTYAVRLYSSDDTTFYLSGLIAKRDGGIETVRLADLDGKGEQQLVVVVRSAGTGGYLSAQAFSFADKRIEARSHVENLPKDADPVAALTHTTKSDKVMGKGKYHDPNAGARP